MKRIKISFETEVPDEFEFNLSEPTEELYYILAECIIDNVKVEKVETF